MTVAILIVPSQHVAVMGLVVLFRQFHVENTRDTFGHKFFIETRTDHKMIVLGIAGRKTRP